MERARPLVRARVWFAAFGAHRAPEPVEPVRHAAARQTFESHPRVLEPQDVFVPAAQLLNPPKQRHSVLLIRVPTSHAQDRRPMGHRDGDG